jgi:hypothetical protein
MCIIFFPPSLSPFCVQLQLLAGLLAFPLTQAPTAKDITRASDPILDYLNANLEMVGGRGTEQMLQVFLSELWTRVMFSLQNRTKRKEKGNQNKKIEQDSQEKKMKRIR